jgi:undecaprenyl-diphosphatase
VTAPASRAGIRLALDTVLALVASSLAGNLFGFALSLTGHWQQGAAWERAVLQWFNAHPMPHLADELMLAIPFTGTNLTMLPLALLASLWLWRWRHRATLAGQLLVVTVGSLLLNMTLKWQVGRERPDLFPGRGLYAWSSYPSGHAIFVTSFYFTVALALYRERHWRWPFVAATLLVLLNCLSRLYLSVHWPTDLIGGLLTGTVWLIGTWMAFERYRRRPATAVSAPERASRSA